MPTQQNLKAIADFVCARRGLTPALVDATNLRSVQVQGFVISDETGDDVLNSLAGLFQFYRLDTGDLMKFNQMKDAPFAGLIEATHVGFMGQDAESGGALIEHSKRNDLPSSVELTFSDPARGYEPNTAIAKLQLVDSNEPRRMSTSAVIPAERAREICDSALAAIWEAQTRTSVVVPVDYAHVDAGDIVEFDGGLWRVTRKLFSYPLAFKLELSRFSYAPFKGVKSPSVGTVEVVRPVEREHPVFLPLDVQLLNDTTDASGFYYVAYAQRGHTVARSATLYTKATDGTWSAISTAPVGAKVGVVTGMPIGLATVFDQALTVSVTLVSSGALTSCTLERALAGENRCLIGNELCAFTTATQTGADTYQLSGIVRGLGGDAPGAKAGARFVLLEPTYVANAAIQSSRTGQADSYKLLGDEAPAATAVEALFTNTNQRIRPLKPVHIYSNPGQGVTVLSWVRQARKDYSWMDEADVPLDYARERYEVQLLDAAGAIVGSGYTVESATQLALALPNGAVGFRVRQLGDLLPGAWAEAALT